MTHLAHDLPSRATAVPLTLKTRALRHFMSIINPFNVEIRKKKDEQLWCTGLVGWIKADVAVRLADFVLTITPEP